MNQDIDDRPTGELEAEPQNTAAPASDTERGVGVRPALDYSDSPVFRHIVELAREGVKHIP